MRFGPYVGRNTGRLTYAVMRRLAFPDGRFAGMLMGAMEHAYFEAFCQTMKPLPAYDAALVNAAGDVMARCTTGTDGPVKLEKVQNLALGLDWAGAPAITTQTAEYRQGLLTASIAIPGYDDLFIVTALPTDEVLTDWSRQLARFLILLVLGAGLLSSAGLLIWRQVKALRAVEKSSREALEYERGQLKALIQTIPELIWLKDPAGVYLACNPAFARFLGRQEAEIVGHRDEEFASPEVIAAYRDHDREAAEVGRPVVRKEWVTYAGRSDPVLLATTKMPMHGPDDRLIGVLGISHDITEIHRAEQVLANQNDILESLVAQRTAELARAKRDAETAREQAQAASRAKSAFLANMSHEIRTPLNAITGMVHLIRRSGLRKEQADKLGKIEAAGNHLLETINAILDLSKIEAGKLTLDRAPLRVDALLTAISAILGERAQEKGIALVVEAPTISDPLLGDATRLQQALLNYAANAIKFTEQGQVLVRAVTIAETNDQVTLRFEVVDTGVGIAADVLPRLFSAFEQADSSTARKYGGSGLGLAITRHVAELMGGSAGAGSEPGRGSTFWFTAVLDRMALGDGAPAVLAHEAAEQTLLRDHAGKRVLLVDDEPINLQIAAMFLEDAGLVVDTASDGQEALDRAAAGTYDVVLMDMQMPVMDGLEATRRLRRLAGCADLPVLAMTANAFAEDRARCTAAGMNDFILKPTKPEVLFATLLKWLSGASTPAGRR